MAKTGHQPLGVHTSIAGGLRLAVDRAVELGCTAMQIFGRNPRSWTFTPVPDEDVSLFRQKREEAGLWPVAVHATYLINLSSADDALFRRSLNLFKDELSTCASIGADYFVTHLGSPGEKGSGFAINRVITALKEAASEGLFDSTEALLENTSGSGSGFGSSLADIGRIIREVEGEGIRAGLCFDTCHAFAAGYPMKTAEDIEALVRVIGSDVGLKRLRLIHLNDSKGEEASRLDRHEHIGHGKIGPDGIAFFINHPSIKDIPLILETPKKAPDDDPRNLKAVIGMLQKRYI